MPRRSDKWFPFCNSPPQTHRANGTEHSNDNDDDGDSSHKPNLEIFRRKINDDNVVRFVLLLLNAQRTMGVLGSI